MTKAGTFGSGVYLTEIFAPYFANGGLKWIADILEIPPQLDDGHYCIEKCYGFVDFRTDTSLPIVLRMRTNRMGEPVKEFAIFEDSLSVSKSGERFWDVSNIPILSGIFSKLHR